MGRTRENSSIFVSQCYTPGLKSTQGGSVSVATMPMPANTVSTAIWIAAEVFAPRPRFDAFSLNEGLTRFKGIKILC